MSGTVRNSRPPHTFRLQLDAVDSRLERRSVGAFSPKGLEFPQAAITFEHNNYDSSLLYSSKSNSDVTTAIFCARSSDL
jgi:hypothetical protein